MIKNNLSIFLTVFSVLLALPVTTSFASQAQAQLVSAESSSTPGDALLDSFSVNFVPSEDNQAPKSTVGGASRGSCSATLADRPPLIPVMPRTQQGLTLAERPTFFIYVPDTEAQTALLTIRDENEDYDYEKEISLPPTPGVMSVKLPADAPEMEVNKTYQWNFALICGQTMLPDDPTVWGEIQLVNDSTLRNQLGNLSLADRVVLSGEQGIWYDTLASLATLREAHPGNENLANNWKNLLTSVGLEAIATEPVINLSVGD